MSTYLHRHFIAEEKNLVISGYTPSNSTRSRKAIIWFQGAPTGGDVGDRTIPEAAQNKDISFFYPDYYGVFRSGGSFTIENCALTVRDTIRALQSNRLQEVQGTSLTQTTFNFEQILCVFSSFAGWIPLWMHIHMSEEPEMRYLNDIAWHCPLIDIARQANNDFPYEESLAEFMFLLSNVYHLSYRNLNKEEWYNFFLHSDSTSELYVCLDKIRQLRTSIVHGKNDTVISPQKSNDFFNLLSVDQQSTHHLHLLEQTGHGGPVMEQKAILHYLKDFAF